MAPRKCVDLFVIILIFVCQGFCGKSTDYDADMVHEAELRLRNRLNSSYYRDVLPPHNNSSPVKVQLELSILAIRELDFRQQILATDCWIRVTWVDSRLTWDKNLYGNINSLRFATDKIWQPDIKLYNNVHGNQESSIGEVYALVNNNGKVDWIPPVTFKTFCELDIRFYPYDEHECSFRFGSWTHDGYHLQVDLFANKTKIEYSYMWHQGGEWLIVSSRAKATVTTYACCEEPYPDATFYVTLRRRSPFFKAAVLTPVIAVVGLILTAFWLSPVAAERIVLNCVALLVAVATLMNLTAKLPPTGDVAPLIVTFCSMLAILSVVVTIMTVLFSNVCKTRRNEILPHWMDVLLRTRVITTIFCIAPPESFERFANDSEAGNQEDSKPPRSGSGVDSHSANRWISFFQLVDRSAFVLCSILIVATLISLSA